MLTEKQIKACELLFEDIKTDEEIASECEISRRQLCNWKLEEEFKKFLLSLAENGLEKVKFIYGKNAEKAAKTMAKALEDKKMNKVQIEAAKDILDRIGYKPVDKKEIELKTNSIEGKSIEEMSDEELDNYIKTKNDNV